MKRQKASLWTTKEKLLMLQYCYITYLFIVRSAIPWTDENGSSQIHMVCHAVLSFQLDPFSQRRILYWVCNHLFVSNHIDQFKAGKYFKLKDIGISFFIRFVWQIKYWFKHTIFLHYVVLNFLDRGSVMLKN